MDKKFHINSNGDVKPCAATKNACQFGDSSLHFTDAAEARKVAEELLSNSANSRLLEGKKKSLQQLKDAAKVPSSVPPGYQEKYNKPKVTVSVVSSPQTFEAREDAFIKKVAGTTHKEELIGYAPREVEELFVRGLGGRSELRTFLKDRSGNYKAVSYSKTEDRFIEWEAPPTKDIPIKMGVVGGWNMSFHPNGPKITYQCGQCNARGQERLGNFPYRRQGDFRIRCRYCHQLGTVPLQYG